MHKALFLDHFPDVSRETLEKLECYEGELKKWSKKINIIGRDTIQEIWSRHFLDSAQLVKDIGEKENVSICDIGTGAGFPGVIIALLCPHADVTCVDSNHKKISFINQLVPKLGINLSARCERIEAIKDKDFDIITSRALATVSDILKISNHLLKKDGKYLLLKGKNIKDELTEAKEIWHIKTCLRKSIVNPEGVVLEMRVSD